MRFDSSYSKMLRAFSNYERNTGKRHPRSLGIKDSKRAFAHVEIQYVDNLWMGPISVGTPAVQFIVNFDTGSADFFLATTGCESSHDLTLYDPDGSSTAVPLSRPFNSHYADGTSASGLLYTDTVTIGNLIATRQTLGAASEWRKLQESRDEGIIGMAFQSLSDYNALPVFQNFVDQRRTNSPIFAMKLVEDDALLTLGGLGDDLYNPPITYVDVLDGGHWAIKCNSLSVGGRVIVDGIPCVIDSACSN
jgi:cathepsin D